MAICPTFGKGPPCPYHPLTGKWADGWGDGTPADMVNNGAHDPYGAVDRKVGVCAAHMGGRHLPATQTTRRWTESMWPIGKLGPRSNGVRDLPHHKIWRLSLSIVNRLFFLTYKREREPTSREGNPIPTYTHSYTHRYEDSLCIVNKPFPFTYKKERELTSGGGNPIPTHTLSHPVAEHSALSEGNPIPTHTHSHTRRQITRP